MPGVYLRVLKAGHVKKGDAMILIEEHPDGISIRDMYMLLYDQNIHLDLAKKALDSPYLTINNRKDVLKKYRNSISN